MPQNAGDYMARSLRQRFTPKPTPSPEELAYAEMNPVDAYKLSAELQNAQKVSPEQAAANRKQNARDALSIIPGPGNYIAAEDAIAGARDARESFGAGKYKQGTLQAALAALSGVGAVTGLPTGKMAGRAAKGAKDSAAAFPAWHGSPHDFDEFKLDKIGTGEGAQAYGHGLYFAENPATATAYQRNLRDNVLIDRDGKSLPYRGGGYAKEERAALRFQKADGDFDKAIANLNAEREAYAKRIGWEPSDGPIQQFEDELAALKGWQADGVRLQNPGRLYHTEIDAEPHQLLDWDKPFGEQSEDVRGSLMALLRKESAEAGGRPPSWQAKGEEIYDWLSSRWAAKTPFEQQNIGGGRDYASTRLREAGIPGLRYLDQGSRGPAVIYNVGSPRKDFGPYSPYTTRADAEKQAELLRKHGFDDAEITEQLQPQTSNFVIFDDKLVKILGKE